MKKGQTQTLYSLAAVLGLVESGSKEDPFHMLVYRIAGKTSVRALTKAEAYTVERELRQRLQLEQPKKQKTASSDYPDKMTARQKSYAWKLLYQLADISPSDATIGDRMAGIIRKVLQEDPCPGHPLNWVSFENGSKLIEALKRYLKNAKRKAAKQNESG